MKVSIFLAHLSELAEQKKCRAILQRLNFMDRADFEGIASVVKELFGTSDGAFVNPPFYCDYGSHIHVGKNFFANYNCTIIDVAPVTIGDNCQMAPNVAIYTAGHPVHPAARNTAYEYGIGVTIGDSAGSAYRRQHGDRRRKRRDERHSRLVRGRRQPLQGSSKDHRSGSGNMVPWIARGCGSPGAYAADVGGKRGSRTVSGMPEFRRGERLSLISRTGG